MTAKLELLHKYIDPEKLPWDYREICEIVGLEKTLEIAGRVGGTHIYMEKLERVLSPFVREYILEQFSVHTEGVFNVRKVARDMDISQDTVYEVLRRRNEKEEDEGRWKQETLI